MPTVQPMVDQCHSNWGKWKELAEERKQEKERLEREKLEREQEKEEEEKLVGFFNFDIRHRRRPYKWPSRLVRTGK